MIGCLAKKTAVVHLRVGSVVGHAVAVIGEDVGWWHGAVLRAGVELPSKNKYSTKLFERKDE